MNIKDAYPTFFGKSVPSSGSRMCQYPAGCNIRYITNTETRFTLDLNTHYRPEHILPQTRIPQPATTAIILLCVSHI